MGLPIDLINKSSLTESVIMKITLPNREFRFSPLGLLGYLLLVSVLCSLGFWQLGRSEQKRQFLLQQQTAAETEALDLNRITIVDVDAIRYRKVDVSGHYDTARQFLVDNQMFEGKPGYFVLTPFLIDNSNRAVLVNRGWLALGKDRKILPDISIQVAVQHIKGRINHFPAVGIRLEGAEIPTDGWPAVVQVVDSQILSEKLAYDLYDFQIELDAIEVEGYKRDWKINTLITPEKHLGYAVQWFGLALTLTGLFIWISGRKRSEHTV